MKYPRNVSARSDSCLWSVTDSAMVRVSQQRKTGYLVAIILVLGLGACGGRSGPPAPVIDMTGAGSGGKSWQPRNIEKGRLGSSGPQRGVAGGRARPLSLARGSLTSRRAVAVRVGRGDTLYGIARRHKVPLRALIDANRLLPPYRLKAGRRLRIPAVRVYVVAKGDTVYAIGRRFGVNPVRILRENRIQRTKGGVYPGQKLILPKPLPRPKGWSAPPAPGPGRGASGGKVDRPAPRSSVEATPLPPIRTTIPSRPKPGRRAAGVKPPPWKNAPVSSRPPPRAGAFLWPLRGRLLSTFGAKGGGQFNDGINIAGREGAPVRAAETGIVAYAGNELRGYGNLLLIRHSGGWVSAYAHNRDILVTKGQVVRRGQTVARVGRSGGVGRPQLHFELRRGPRAINPVPYLRKRG